MHIRDTEAFRYGQSHQQPQSQAAAGYSQTPQVIMILLILVDSRVVQC